MKRIILGITGASGAPIGVRLAEVLSQEARVALVMSANAASTLDLECGPGARERITRLPNVTVYDPADMAARVSSGSDRTDAMIIAPCSMSTLAAVRCGLTLNLIHRAASVMLKEKRPLILVPRESPLSPIHLENMLDLARLGVHMVPATTAFYTRPRSVADMVDFTCARVLDLAGVGHTLSKRWKGEQALRESHS